MTNIPLTPAQRTALEWLPADGQGSPWGMGQTRSLLVLERLGYVTGRYAPRDNDYSWCITPAGEALRKEFSK